MWGIFLGGGNKPRPYPKRAGALAVPFFGTPTYVDTIWPRRRRRFCIDTRSVAWELIPFSALSRWGLNPIKPGYDQDGPDGWFNLTTSALNHLGQYTSSPGRRGYCYAELAVFFPSDDRNHRRYSLHLPTEGWPGWVGLGGWLRSETVYLPEYSHPSQ